MKKGLPWLFWVALALAVFFRFVNLSGNPPSLSHDEVAIGYNAYSILKTGRDEYGVKFPLLFRSFDDYKLPGMVYASVPAVALFGLTEFGVRFPSAFLGLIAVLAMFGISRELLKSDTKASFAMLMFALSPWHINFSRQSFEANGSLTFFMLGVWFLLRFGKRATNLIWAACLFAISLYFYYSVRLVLPVVLLVFIIVERKKLRTHLRTVLLSMLAGFLLLVPLLPQIFSQGGLSRVSIVSVTNDPVLFERQKQFAAIRTGSTNPVTRLVYNRRVALGVTILENYAKNLSPKFIFENGTGSLGLLHKFELPLFLVGIFALFHIAPRLRWVVIAWMLASPLPGAFSTNQPNALRSLLNAPVLSLISSLGAMWFYDRLKKPGTSQKLALSAFVLALGWALFVFSYSYFYYVPRTKSAVFADGYKQLALYLRDVEDAYDMVHMTGFYWRPYIFMLFWNAYDPKLYQSAGTPTQFANYRFTPAEWDEGSPKMMLRDFKPEELGIQNPKKELVILSGQEYRLHEDKFVKIASIDGKYHQGLFIAALLRTHDR